MIVALTGFMMCGKSTYGYAVAQRLGVPFIDLDEHIEDGLMAGEIIRLKGEEVFRREETAALEGILTAGGDFILALGGGTPMREENRALLRDRCRVIWIKAPLEESVFNPEWASLVAQRPLLDGVDRQRITRLWESRVPVYESVADYVVNTAGKNPEEVLDELSKICRLYP